MASSSRRRGVAVRSTGSAERWAAGSASPSAAARGSGGLGVNSHFDSGNIEVLDLSDPGDVRLAIIKDPYCETDATAHAQWFNFRVTGARGVPLTLHITNAGACSYPAAWEGYAACASHDLDAWFRVPTAYDAATGVLTIRHTPGADSIRYSYFPVYNFHRHMLLVSRMQTRPRVRLVMLAETLDGHDLDVLMLGEPGPGKRVVWIVARQHPGETQSEWFAEGLLERLTDPHDAVSRALLDGAVFYVVPNACPDGTWRGHLRTNAAGVNLNRAWDAPREDEAPEVFHIRRLMDDTGVDMLVDVHGDEEIPACFIAGAEGIPGWTGRLAGLQAKFSAAFSRASPDFQTKLGYEVDAPGQADMRICSNQARRAPPRRVPTPPPPPSCRRRRRRGRRRRADAAAPQIAQRFDCLAVTLEMPFKLTAADAGDPAGPGWGPERAKRFGGAMLGAVLDVLPDLRP
ncbi:hypothetical protein HT031_001444 [Scenedesmus sp. PABB004]|nr:hypothetical protein HT031_001444 [Scenedesmus sp. PABB004]